MEERSLNLILLLKRDLIPQKNIEDKLDLEDVATALKQVCSSEKESIVFTALPQESFPEKTVQSEDNEIYTLDDFLSSSANGEDFCLKMEYFPQHSVEIEEKTRGQSDNPLWFAVRRHMITASKAHDVKTRMTT